MSVEELFCKLTTWGSMSSIAGLIVTFWVAWSVKAIRKAYKSQAIIPKYKTTLSKNRKTLVTACEHKNEERIRDCLAACRHTLDNLRPYLDKPRKKSIKILLRMIEDAQNNTSRDSCIRKVASELNGLIVSLGNMQIENQWSHK